MKMDMQLIDNSFGNCFEAILANISYWKGRSYELMYINEWNFKFNLQNNSIQNRLGNSLDSYCDKRNAFNLYYGIKYTEYECLDLKNIIKILSEELLSKPITVRMDTFHCPWDKSYMKHHNKNHIFFINGLDYKQEFLYCTDPFYLIKDKAITFDNFIKGYSGRYGLFEIEEDRSEFIDGRKLLINILTSIIKNNIFDSIRSFAHELDKTVSFSDELEGFEEAWQTPLYSNVAAIENSRKRVPVLLLFIANKYNIKEVIDYSDEIRLISEKWDGIRGLILKMLMAENISEIKKRVINRFNEIAKYEELVANHLLNILKR